ncbi:MAG: orotidine 5'-phosphate decarboxylase [Thermotogae bacterium]|nr:orotidine 5'-phosphate decarboxylase [Mesotoga sp.]MCP5461390.1 orotidine 5'-phosphate decarboxylase [Thermotogota bacterium]
MMIRLQLANDTHIKDSFLKTAKEVADYIDILEVGTPAVLAHGMTLVREISEILPDHEILADMKIVDGGYLEAAMAFESGADIVTVLGFASFKTISEVRKAADQFGGELMLDTIEISDLQSFAEKVSPLSPDYICIHTSADLSGVGESMHLLEYAKKIEIIRRVLPEAKIAVAGGISPDNLSHVFPLKPDVVIAGRSIWEAEDPARVAFQIKTRLEKGS